VSVGSRSFNLNRKIKNKSQESAFKVVRDMLMKKCICQEGQTIEWLVPGGQTLGGFKVTSLVVVCSSMFMFTGQLCCVQWVCWCSLSFVLLYQSRWCPWLGPDILVGVVCVILVCNFSSSILINGSAPALLLKKKMRLNKKKRRHTMVGVVSWWPILLYIAERDKKSVGTY
jgi:hypothetical protein